MRLLRRLLPMLLLMLAASTVRAGYCSSGEAWIPVGDGLPGIAVAHAEVNGSLYVIHRESAWDGSALVMSTWDGRTWTKLAKVNIAGVIANTLKLTPFNGDLYLTGTFSRIDDLPATENIARWDGTSWSSVGGGISRGITAVTVYKGELYVAGDFRMAGTLKTVAITRYDGKSWGALGDGIEGKVSDLVVYNDKLFVLGDIKWVEKEGIRNIAIWDGTSWSPGDPALKFAVPARMIVYRDKLYLFGAIGMLNGRIAKMALYESSGWKELSVPDSIPVQNADVAGLDRLFLHRPNVAERQYGGIWTWDGSSWLRISEFDDQVASYRIFSYKGRTYALGDFTASCGREVKRFAFLCTDKECGFIAGSVYQDLDGDCVRDDNEPGVPDRVVEILPGPLYAISGKDGKYHRVMPEAGNYAVSLVPYRYWYASCGVSARPAVLDRPGAGVDSLDFSSRPIPNIRDLRATISGSQPRPGFQVVYTIKYENVGTEPVSGTIRMEYDTVLQYDSSRVAHTRQRPGLIEWDFVKLPVGASGTIQVYMTLSRTAARGSLLCVRLAIDLDEGYEETLRDNRDSLCETITGAYDPNDISVSPLGDLNEDELYRLRPSDTVLSYMVRFQNTGSDTAFTVVVMDTLDLERLNLTTISLGASSHPYDLDIAPDGALRFTFKDILLDSNVNEIGSHGYLKYSVNLKPGLSPSTEILNRAAIYFDFNDPVITNTVVSVTQGTSLSAPYDPGRNATATVYPNPANGRIYVEAETERGAAVTLSTMLGVEAGRWKSDGSGRTMLDISTLPAGVYLLRVETRNGTAVRRLNIVR